MHVFKTRTTLRHGTDNTTSEMLYTYTDRLGSITYITDATDKFLAEYLYDAFGHM